MANILLISDFFYEEVEGGAEINDRNLINLLRKNNKIDQIKTIEFNQIYNIYQNVDLFIISNFYFISEDAKNFLYEKKYIIIEHDYKFLRSRNPCQYENLIAPKNDIIHEFFYKKAKIVLTQSKFQKSIFLKNIDLDNIKNFSGNLWDNDSLKLLKKLSSSSKNGKAALLDTNSEFKGVKYAEDFCIKNRIIYEKIPKMKYEDFIENLSRYSLYVFFPLTPETLSRVTLEAKMLNLAVLTNKNTSAIYEDFYEKSGIELIEIMENKNLEILSIINDCL